MAKTKTAKKEVLPEARFIDNKNNIITDRKTGLEITQDPTVLGEIFKKQMTFEEAEKACAALDFAGHKDWRLPTVEEICGMVDRTKHDPCYDTKIFKGKFDDWYWSNETCVWNKDAAWCVHSGNGYVDGLRKFNHVYVRPVRSSQCHFAPLPVR